MTIFPINWVRAPIGSLCDLKNGRAFKPAEWSQDGLPIVRIQNLNKASAPFNRFNGTYDHKHYLKGGELLFAWSGTPGTSFGAHVWRGGEALLNQHIFRVDFDDALLDRRFFRHAINQKLTELIGVAHGGAGLQHVTKGVFEGTEVALPPRTEQKRIADKLDAVLTRVDAVNTRLARVTPLLKRFRQSVLAVATSGRMPLDQEGENRYADWPNVQLGGICSKVTDGEHATPKRATSGKYLLSARNVRDGSIALENVDFVDQTEFDRLRLRCDPSIGDVLLSCSGSVGRVALVDRDDAYVMVRSAALIRPDREKLIPKFLMYALQSPQLQQQILEASRSTAQANIFLGPIKQLTIALPSLVEQAEIVSRIETLFAFADRLEARLQAAQTAADRLTPSLLAKAFRGELVPQDPNDEPASELLMRLAKQEPTSNTKRLGRKVKST